MRAWLRLSLILSLLAGGALARDVTPELQRLLDHFYEHRRVAAAYLHSDNRDVGAVEIERLREAWESDLKNISSAALADTAFSSAIAETQRIIAATVTAIDQPDSDAGLALLERMAEPLNEWRRAKGIRLLSDCIAEIGGAYQQFDPYRVAAPDMNDVARGAVIVAIASLVDSALARCDAEASADIRANAEFRRLIDGMNASPRQVSIAVQQRDGDYLHRLLIEQRSFERLLAFRYG